MDQHDFRMVDTHSDLVLGAYDESGDEVKCSSCSGDIRFDPVDRIWICQDCGEELDRAQWFNYIGAEPPADICLTNCNENYPFCKSFCKKVEIDEDDPFLDN